MALRMSSATGAPVMSDRRCSLAICFGSTNSAMRFMATSMPIGPDIVKPKSEANVPGENVCLFLDNFAHLFRAGSDSPESRPLASRKEAGHRFIVRLDDALACRHLGIHYPKWGK